MFYKGRRRELPAFFTYIPVLPRDESGGEDAAAGPNLFLQHLHTQYASANSSLHGRGWEGSNIS